MDPLSPRQEEKLDVLVRAAWLYYVARNTQNEIAQKLGISRPTAQRLVTLAAERGLVNVRINHKGASCLELAIALRQRYNLVVCEVVPVDSDNGEQILRKIAVAGVQVMESFITQGGSKIIGLGSGRTIKAVISELDANQRHDHCVVSLVGTIASDGASSPFEVALQAAEKVGKKCFLFPAPFLADSAEERRQWCRHRLYKIVEELSNRADVTFVGIGDISPGCPMQSEGFITKEEVRDLLKAGAIGEVLGWAFDQSGELVRGSSQERVTSIRLPHPPPKPVIACAGGGRKAQAILGALRGRWINGLVTDEACARKILEA